MLKTSLTSLKKLALRQSLNKFRLPTDKNERWIAFTGNPFFVVSHSALARVCAAKGVFLRCRKGIP